jgi:hypothetical protein
MSSKRHCSVQKFVTRCADGSTGALPVVAENHKWEFARQTIALPHRMTTAFIASGNTKFNSSRSTLI